MYPAEIVIPMKEELTENGFVEMLTAEEVDSTLSQKGTALVVINSVCGCSAGTARPGVLLAVHKSSKKPDQITTSFAGFDTEAVNQVRKLKQELYEVVAEHSGQTPERIAADFDRDFWMTAMEAKEYGLVDEVLLTNPRKQK